MVKSAKKIVIIGIGNIGFSILKQLNNLNDDLEIIAIARRFPTYLKDYSSQIRDNIKLTFIEADATDASRFQEIVNAENLNGINVLISTVGFSSQSNNFESGKTISLGYYKSFQPNRIHKDGLIDNMQVLSLLSKADRQLGRLDIYSEYVNIDLFNTRDK